MKSWLFVVVGISCLAIVAPLANAAKLATAPAQAPIDADTLPKGGADATTIVRWIGSGLYQLEVQNTSSIGFIDTFNWVPPEGLTVTAVTSTEGGHCYLEGGDIECSGTIKPPLCTCQAGGQLTVNFSATGDAPTWNGSYWTYYGIVGSYLEIQTMTPVPYHIPSYSQGASNNV